MPTYTINGKKVTTASELTDAQIDEIAADLQGKPKAPAEPAAPPVKTSQPSIMEQMFGAGSPIARVAKGAIVDPLLSVNQALANTGLFGDTVKEGANATVAAYDKATQEGRARVGSEGFDAFQLLGNVLSPASKIAKVAPAATKLGQVAQTAGVSAAMTGLTSPITDVKDYASQKLDQMGQAAFLGALTAGGIEAVKGGAKFVNELVKTTSTNGRQTILREYLDKLAGPDKEKIINALRNTDEKVAGSKPTAAEALADIPQATSLAKYQSDIARQGETGASAKFAAREAEQEAARLTSIRTVGKTPQALEAAVSARAADATRNYGDAYSKVVVANPELAQLATNPYIKDAIPDAIKLAEAKGITAKTDLTQFLHFVKLGMDKQLAKVGDTALSTTEKAAVQKAKSELTQWVNSKNPSYQAAREEFSKASKPINQMQIGQYLEDSLQVALKDKENAGAFAKAVADAPSTIKKASGSSVGTSLDQILTPKQKAVVDNLLADVQRSSKADALARKTGSLGDKAPEANEMPHLLNRTATVMNTVLKAIRDDATTEINKVATDLLLNPQKLADFMSAVPKNRAKDISEALMARMTPEQSNQLRNLLVFSGTKAGAE
jgi:hypothetical protein